MFLYRFRFLLSLFLILPIGCSKMPVDSTNNEINKLIFSEVYLDSNQPSKNWVEIYNPTKKTLVLEKFRTYYVKTDNCLPLNIKKQGGFLLEPGEYVLICAETKPDSANENILIVDPLSRLYSGGFMALTTKGMDIEGVDGFRYGLPEMSVKVEDYCGENVVPFSENGKSYSRKILEMVENRDLVDFYETNPTPGRTNE